MCKARLMQKILVLTATLVSFAGSALADETYRGIYFAGPEMSRFVTCGDEESLWLTSYSKQAHDFFMENKRYPIYLEVKGRLAVLDNPKVTASGSYDKQLFATGILDSASAGYPAYEACRAEGQEAR